MAARAGVEPTTLRLKAIASTKGHHVPITEIEAEITLGILATYMLY